MKIYKVNLGAGVMYRYVFAKDIFEAVDKVREFLEKHEDDSLELYSLELFIHEFEVVE